MLEKLQERATEQLFEPKSPRFQQRPYV